MKKRNIFLGVLAIAVLAITTVAFTTKSETKTLTTGWYTLTNGDNPFSASDYDGPFVSDPSTGCSGDQVVNSIFIPNGASISEVESAGTLRTLVEDALDDNDCKSIPSSYIVNLAD